MIVIPLKDIFSGNSIFSRRNSVIVPKKYDSRRGEFEFFGADQKVLIILDELRFFKNDQNQGIFNRPDPDRDVTGIQHEHWLRKNVHKLVKK